MRLNKLRTLRSLRDCGGRCFPATLGTIGLWSYTVAHLQSGQCDADMPAELEELIPQCLTKDLNGRPQSVTGISRVLSECHTADSWGPKDAGRWWSAHEFDLEPGDALEPTEDTLA